MKIVIETASDDEPLKVSLGGDDDLIASSLLEVAGRAVGNYFKEHGFGEGRARQNAERIGKTMEDTIMEQYQKEASDNEQTVEGV